MVNDRDRRGAVEAEVLVWLRAEGLAALTLSASGYGALHGRWWLFAALFLVPDLSMLGYLAGAKPGATTYNVAHSYLLPIALAVVVLATHRLPLLALACIWTARIGFDRMLGYGLKYPSAFQHTHLGSLGAQNRSRPV